MKKILLVLALMFGFVLNVNAQNYTISQVDDSTLSIGGSCSGCYKEKVSEKVTNSFVTIPYSVNYNGGKYAAYCLDPNSPDEFTVRVAATINANTTSKYYAGLYAIATNEKAYFNSNITKDNIDQYSYSSTNLALRMWKVATGNGEYGNIDYGGTKAYVKVIGKTAANIMAENASVAKKATGYNCSTAKCFYESFGLGGTYESASALKGPAATDVLPKAKELFIAALNGASGVSKGTSSGVSSDIVKSTSMPTAKANTSSQFVQYDYYDISVSNFSSSNYVSDISLSCINCTSISGNPTVSISRYSLDNGATWSNGTPSNATLKGVTGNGKVIIEVTSKINRNSGYKCDDINVKIDYKYYAPTSDKSVLLLEPANSTNGQDFVAIIPSGSDGSNNIPVSKNFTINFCDGNNKCEYYDPKDFEEMTEEEFEQYTEDCCSDLESYCKDSSNPAQQQYCDMYDEYCGACDTRIVVPNACQLTEDGVSSEVNVEGTTGYVESAVDEDGNKNIKACLLMRKKDEAGHSYKDEAFKNNAYCQVYCVEDFTFNLPDIKTVNSGTYFQLDATISGTKTCYTSKIDVEKFKTDISGLDSSSTAYQNAVKDYNACVNMEVDYNCFDPQIEYEYEEIYNSQLGSNDKFEPNGVAAETDKKTTYCTGDIEDDYDCIGTSSSTPSKITINGKEFARADYVKSTVKKTGLYKTPSVFYTQIDGSITTDGSANNATIINGLPVELDTTKGRHQFTLTLSNIGEYYDKSSCDSGRIIGDENSIYDKQNKDKGNTGIMKAEYMCYYDVNCPECDFECEGPLCNIDQCDGVNCTPTCLGNGCAYSEAGLSYAYRTVSLNNLNPSNRQLGYNWSTDSTKNKAALKVTSAIREIETNGDAAYENDPLYSFTLTPSLITAIKEHNNTELANGGYANDSLVCEDYTYNGVTYKNVNCKSTLIEDLDNGTFGNVNVTVPDDAKRFINWPESDYCQNNVCTMGSGIGPSYK